MVFKSEKSTSPYPVSSCSGRAQDTGGLTSRGSQFFRYQSVLIGDIFYNYERTEHLRRVIIIENRYIRTITIAVALVFILALVGSASAGNAVQLKKSRATGNW